MRSIPAFIFVFFAWIPDIGHAAEKCDVINALERIQFAQSRLAQSPQFPKNHPDAVLLADHLLRLDHGNIKSAVLPNGTASEVVALQRYYDTVVGLNSAVLAGQSDAVTTYFTSKTFRDVQLQMRTLLPRFGCNNFVSQGEQGTSRQGQSISKIIASKVKFSLQGTIWGLLGTLALCLVAGWGAMQFNRFKRTQKRRAKRHPTSIRTQIRLSPGVLLDVTAIDISGRGAKLQIYSEDTHDTGTPVHALLDDTWHKGKIVW